MTKIKRRRQLPQVKRAVLHSQWDGALVTDEFGHFIPCRGLPYYPGMLGSLWVRFKLAFGVFVGAYDALDWEQ